MPGGSLSRRGLCHRYCHQVAAGPDDDAETTAQECLRESGTPGHPARGRYRSRQVSWLTGHRFGPPSRGRPQWLGWTFARRLQLRGQLRPRAV